MQQNITLDQINLIYSRYVSQKGILKKPLQISQLVDFASVSYLHGYERSNIHTALSIWRHGQKDRFIKIKNNYYLDKYKQPLLVSEWTKRVKVPIGMSATCMLEIDSSLREELKTRYLCSHKFECETHKHMKELTAANQKLFLVLEGTKCFENIEELKSWFESYKDKKQVIEIWEKLDLKLQKKLLRSYKHAKWFIHII